MTRNSRSGEQKPPQEHVQSHPRELNQSGSRNCTKHGCRCDYRDLPISAREIAGSPAELDLQYTAEAEQDIDEWQRTGVFPFPELGVRPEPQWRLLPATDLRLYHHIASVSVDMQRRGYDHCTVWTAQIPT